MGSDESVKNALTTKWVSYTGSAGFDPDAVYALATDSHTNAYLGGVLGSGWLDNYDVAPIHTIGLFEPSGLSGSGFVAKTDNDGVLAWASTLTYNMGILVSSTIYGVTSANEEVYACGFNNYEYDEFGDLLLFPWTDAMLSSLSSSNGTSIWSHELSLLPGVDYYNTTNAYRSVAVDSSGNIYAVGYTTITNLPASITNSAYAGGKDVVIIKYASDGTLGWVRYLGGSNDEEAHAVSIGQEGLYVIGTTQSPGSWITLGNNTLPSVANRCGFLAKLDFNGNVTYTTVLGGNAPDEILAMQTFSNMIYLAGTTLSTNFCQAHKLNNSGGFKDGFVLKLTDNGATYATNWFRYVGTNTVDTVRSLALMDSNRVVVCGSTGVGGWMPEHDEFSKAYSGGTDGFILQLNRDTGAPLWSTYVGGEGDDAADALVICGKSVFLGGTTGSDGWEMFGGFRDQWGSPDSPHLNTETGFVGKWSQDPGSPPVIMNDITNVTVHAGMSNVFFFGVSSKVSIKYYWFTNGVSVGVSTNRYVIESALPSDSGTYQCIASNVLGCATSSVAHLTVIANGMIDVLITPQSAVAAGATWQLTGGVWRTNGVIAVYPGTYTIAFTNLTGGWTPPATCQVAVVSSQTTTVVAVYVAPVATAVRTITSWTNVSLTVTCPSSVTNWTLVEQIPTNVTPANLVGDGVWSSTARTLTYMGTGSPTIGYTALISTNGNFEISGSITSMPINVTMPVTGGHTVSRGSFLRKINGTNVWIYMFSPTIIRSWTVGEYLSQTPLTPDNVTSSSGTVEWYIEGGDLFWTQSSIGAGIVLSYTVSGPIGSTNNIAGGWGYGTFSGVIFGDNTVIIPPVSEPVVPVPPPTISHFVWNGTSASLIFTSIVAQAYMVLTNANISVTNGWRNCVPAIGQGATTTVEVPVIEPQLFYRVKSD